MRTLPATAFAVLTLVSTALFVAPANAALPPTSPTELAQGAQIVVVATVTNTAAQGPVPTTEAHAEGWVGPVADDQAQLVTLKIKEIVRWPKSKVKPRIGSTLKAVKPLNPYSLAVGTTAMFMINTCTKANTLLGRYGTADYAANPPSGQLGQPDLRAALKATPAVPCTK